MNLTINKELISRLQKEGFYPDNMMSVVFAMLALQSEPELLDNFDDYNTSRRAIVLYYDLLDKGLWEEAPESDLHFKITMKGTKFLNEIKHIMNPTPETEPVQQGEVEDWIGKWLDLFPKGVAPGGKLLRSDAKSCLIKMKKFVKEYQYPPEVIMAATKEYLMEREQKDWAYTKAAVYFIDKRGEGSEMAAWCAKQVDKPTVTKGLTSTFI